MLTDPIHASLRCSLLLLLLPLIQSCTAAPPFDAKSVVQEWVNFMQRDYQLRPNDLISVQLHPEGLEQEEQIPRAGKVTFKRLKQPVAVAGKSLDGLRSTLKTAYSKVFVGDVEVQVVLVRSSQDSVYVAGEVKRPGPVVYDPAMTLSQAVSSAGGLTITAEPADVRVLRHRPGATPKTYRINYDSILYESYPDFLVLPGDVVYCRPSGIGQVGYWVELWFRRLLPINIGAAPLAP